MYRVTIQYAVPEDPEAFDRRYAEGHVPLVLPVPGLRSFTWSKVRPMGGDRPPGPTWWPSSTSTTARR